MHVTMAATLSYLINKYKITQTTNGLLIKYLIKIALQ